MKWNKFLVIGLVVFVVVILFTIIYSECGEDDELTFSNTSTTVSELIEEEKDTSPSPIQIEETVEQIPTDDVEEEVVNNLNWEIISPNSYLDAEFQPIVEIVKTSETITMVIDEKENSNKPYFNISDYNRNVLIHLLFFEACSCNNYGDVLEQRAVISVVFNRLISGNYEHCYDIEDIVFYKYPDGSCAFTPASDKDRFWNFKDENEKRDFENNYNQLAEKVDYVIEHGCTVPSNVLYFVSNKCYKENSYFKNNHKIYCVYDGTTFLTTERP